MIHADPDAVIAAARGWLGTPCHDQASLRGVGCDCLGLARGVWRDVVVAEPQPIPPYSRDWGETGVREVLDVAQQLAADRFADFDAARKQADAAQADTDDLAAIESLATDLSRDRGKG